MVGFWLVITSGWVYLVPEWPQLGDNGGAHGAAPVKPYYRGRPRSVNQDSESNLGQSRICVLICINIGVHCRVWYP